MSRSRQEVVAEIEALIVELSALDIPDDHGEGWNLTDFMLVELWARFNDGEVEEAVTVNHRQKHQPRWRGHGLLLAAAEVLDED